MKFIIRLSAILTAICLCLGVLAGCGDKTASGSDVGSHEDEMFGNAVDAEASGQEEVPYSRNETLAVGAESMTGVFSPFFSLNDGDSAVCNMTQLPLLELDRSGAPVLLGIQGETRSYGGVDYNYSGVSDIVVTEDEDGKVSYDITIRDDLKFSDGTPVDIDDVIFSMYVFADPVYDGYQQFYASSIEGMAEYTSDMIPMHALMVGVGKDNTDYSKWTEQQQDAFWSEALPKAGEAYAQAVVDYCVREGYNEEGATVAECAASWGYTLDENATAADFFSAMEESCAGDYMALADIIGIGDNLWSFLDPQYKIGIAATESVASISGIQRTGDYSLRIVAAEADADLIYRLALPIVPLHYYGDESKYNYEESSFGFDKGDLTKIREKSSAPMGAGPYVYLETVNDIVYMEANQHYYKGTPLKQYLSYQEIRPTDSIAAVADGTIDISLPQDAKDVTKAVEALGEDAGLSTYTRGYQGYGYIGINANNVKIGDDPASDASKQLRKALAVMLAAYREPSISDYYGDMASVIEYPITTTSWLAPQPEEEGYSAAYSVNASGEAIYWDGMTLKERYDAAAAAALSYFEAAGYTQEDGVLTAAPEGGVLDYNLYYTNGEDEEHPCFAQLRGAAEALQRIGFTLTLHKVESASDLYTYYSSGSAELWCGAWHQGVMPMLRQLYHSEGTSNVYGIADETLDGVIQDAEKTLDQAQQKALYRTVLDTVLDWAVEVPVYQRFDAYGVAASRVGTTLPENMTEYYSWEREIEKIG